MLRYVFATMLCAAAVNLSAAVPAQNSQPRAAAQSAGRAQVDVNSGHLAQQTEPLPPELETLLAEWAAASAKIRRLEGEHLRRVYDMTFEVEKLSEGKFYFEFPDKGRIDVSPTEITAAMRKSRADNPGKVQKKKNGQLFDLESDREEKWICDGMRVFSVDEAKKEAEVVQLPPDLQGTNIMDSPLPFLFGMPPDKAKRRFALSFSRPFAPSSGIALLTALPRLPQDAQGWSKAEVILDLKTFLPRAVRLIDPAETKITVFEFANMEVNHREWLRWIPVVPRARMFEPDLRGYHVAMIGSENTPRDKPGAGTTPDRPGNREAIAGTTRLADPGQKLPEVFAERRQPAQPDPGIMPNLAGSVWTEAVKELESIGFQQGKEAAKRIILVRGTATGNRIHVNTVEKQDPAPGTRIDARSSVQLWIYTAP